MQKTAHWFSRPCPFLLITIFFPSTGLIRQSHDRFFVPFNDIVGAITSIAVLLVRPGRRWAESSWPEVVVGSRDGFSAGPLVFVTPGDGSNVQLAWMWLSLMRGNCSVGLLVHLSISISSYGLARLFIVGFQAVTRDILTVQVVGT
jgi:hypothetical protein